MLSLCKRLHILDYAALLACGLLAGALSGGVMNIFNGWLSPDYFALAFYYPGGSPSWTQTELYWHSIAQGLLEGLICGGVMASVFTVFVFVVSRSACRFHTAAPYLFKMVAAAFVFWTLGGLNGVIIALVSPQFLSYITDLGGTPTDRLKYFWVGGSIYGVYFGGLVSLLLGCAWFGRDWRRQAVRATL